mmetsp:Transcript_52465/g.170400  ORF Transcript_52465/g.170400 Transcript_52465/m.170400 type:complete len:243 (-) Transcript_52465:1185-1913(-)
MLLHDALKVDGCPVPRDRHAHILQRPEIQQMALGAPADATRPRKWQLVGRVRGLRLGLRVGHALQLWGPVAAVQHADEAADPVPELAAAPEQVLEVEVAEGLADDPGRQRTVEGAGPLSIPLHVRAQALPLRGVGGVRGGRCCQRPPSAGRDLRILKGLPRGGGGRIHPDGDAQADAVRRGHLNEQLVLHLVQHGLPVARDFVDVRDAAEHLGLVCQIAQQLLLLIRISGAGALSSSEQVAP